MRELLRAAWVIGRRDFVAVVFSRAFFFFLLGPVLPLALGVGAGSFSGQMARDIDKAVFAVVMEKLDADALLAARESLAEQLGSRRMPTFDVVDPGSINTDKGVASLLDSSGETDYIGVVSGSLAKPVLTGPPAEIARWQGPVQLLVGQARNANTISPVTVETQLVGDSAGMIAQVRLLTAQIGQFLLFMLVVFLAGMVLSNLVEEKTNKIIEVLAASVPIDAIFLGKLFAMLVIALIGIATWAALAMIGIAISGSALPNLPEPAVGWTAFVLLGVLYFAMAYLLMGSLFLGIGAMATTVRDVQTLSMPVVMMQMVIFFLAAYAVPRMGEPIELAAMAFPFSSPFAMIARAAQQEMLWPHLLAMAWQLLWAYLIIRIGAYFFRRNVLKSGRPSAGRSLKRLFGRA